MDNPVVSRIAQRAKDAHKRIILPEAADPRVLSAARRVTESGYAQVILLGQPEDVLSRAKESGVRLDNVEIVDPLTDTERSRYVDSLYERRKHRGMNRPGADELLENPVYYAGMMVDDKRGDGMVAGSICPTRDTVRSALFGVGCAPNCKTVSSCSLMVTIVPEIGTEGALIFADTGVLPEPTPEQLADIAIAAAGACRALLQVEPHVAMLSFSTKGSASSPAVEKVIEATEIAQARRPDLAIDGELQLDAAIIPEIAIRKARGSRVAGRANTLVFPDLSSGNIGYKLAERLGRAVALGPLLLGLAKPVNDLSRGCSVEDIALISAITAVQADAGDS
jgi:phosphate acetyltransferase